MSAARSSGAGKAPIRLGVDFDNTLVCYDRAFACLAAERGLSPASRPGDEAITFKRRLRDHLRASGREQEWTELQGVAYGGRIGEAHAFEGALACLQACAAGGVEIYVVSHKTRVPYAGAPTDLRAAASAWLDANGFTGAGAPIGAGRVFFESTLEAKLARIAAIGCTHFVDDLPELLADPQLAPDLVRILFDPGCTFDRAPAFDSAAAPDPARAFAPDGASDPAVAPASRRGGLVHARSWDEVRRVILDAAPRARSSKESSAA